MLKLAFLTMPETLLAFPSIGLAEIASSLRTRFGEKIAAKIFYPCLDYVRFIGLEDYMILQANGLNQWMFRECAYPEQSDTELLRKKFLDNNQSVANERIFEMFLEKRKGIRGYLEKLIEDYRLLEYDVIGISSTFSQNMASFALAKMIKKVKPDCIVTMGGANCEYPMGKAIIDNVPEVDYVFSGLGICSTQQFVQCLLDKDEIGVHQINGVFSHKNQVVENESYDKEGTFFIKSRGELHPINTPFDFTYDYDEFLSCYHEFCKDTGFGCKPILLFETSRGCWKRDVIPCTFCGLNNPEVCFESMNAECAIPYIQKLINRYGEECSIISCVDNIIDKKYINEVLPHLDIPRDVSIMYETSAILSKEQMKICVDNKINLLQPGIESLNTAELKLMQKGISAFTNVLFLKHCVEVGIYPVWSYLYSVPGNTKSSNYDQIKDLLPMMRHLPPPAASVPITVVRYSPFADQKEKYNLNLVPQIGTYDIYPFAEGVIADLATAYTDTTENPLYREIANTYIDDIKMEVVEWMSSFRVGEHMPKLYYMDEDTIYDSRFDIDDPTIYDLTELQKRMLIVLEQPVSYDQLKMLLHEEDEDEVFNDFDELMEKQLLFYEDGRYLSLVCEKFCWERKEFEKLLEYIRLTTISDF